ncbi:PTS system mannose/fructose/N-acetylgalactosamine-transporter subunit IIB [Brachyspira hampsonii]|uniref:PTS mannose/fructose/sorbose transporter subunit IIB n=1 Tax=Brachyspira hampsonii TaxID=1287055 RepID=A0AAC9XKB1_9SPIR|nr:PTS sugar transporter subunit IIB [Brachyspira hampsonii]ASJ21657.1 PTS mannose/fructose/sorbose transporter subunit IIB [Brachyspira hampsonii]ELV05413.1 PTS system mannose/fructose/sorbose transporter subunit IIB [Brachyspira hampsonii 30599]MBW5380958.1 PTS mannose/fructose/sorbose transporter subunit IIB [Brachyspira hampsonii]MBW5409988.1 PTS mannose/fructose/sorbose transporter subunit IIB [Brachyspira hampsonii]OEJ12916.1 PTS sugar transporter subunit IIC [Brachyspira hampsonii]
MKGFVNIRIDSRLIHGQVAGIWAPYLQINRIMIIDDEIANDDMQKDLLRMVAPAGVSTSILTKEKALKNILEDKYALQKVMLVVKTPYYLKYLIENGVEVKSINVGNMSTRENTRKITPTVNITEEEESILKSLINKNVEITVQMVPNDSIKYLKDLL